MNPFVILNEVSSALEICSKIPEPMTLTFDLFSKISNLPVMIFFSASLAIDRHQFANISGLVINPNW